MEGNAKQISPIMLLYITSIIQLKPSEIKEMSMPKREHYVL